MREKREKEKGMNHTMYGESMNMNVSWMLKVK